MKIAPYSWAIDDSFGYYLQNAVPAGKPPVEIPICASSRISFSQMAQSMTMGSRYWMLLRKIQRASPSRTSVTLVRR